MYTFLLAAHITIAVAIVIAVLVQSGKGGGLGAGFGGGGANTLFGSSGGSNFFTKLTMGLAGAFFITSLTLTAIGTKSLKKSIFDQGVPATTQGAPVENAPAANTETPAEASKEASPVEAPQAKTEAKAEKASKSKEKK